MTKTYHNNSRTDLHTLLLVKVTGIQVTACIGRPWVTFIPSNPLAVNLFLAKEANSDLLRQRSVGEASSRSKGKPSHLQSGRSPI